MWANRTFLFFPPKWLFLLQTPAFLYRDILILLHSLEWGTVCWSWVFSFLEKICSESFLPPTTLCFYLLSANHSLEQTRMCHVTCLKSKKHWIIKFKFILLPKGDWGLKKQFKRNEKQTTCTQKTFQSRHSMSEPINQDHLNFMLI